jgi:hypothetical protein
MTLSVSIPADSRLLSDILWPDGQYIPEASSPQFGHMLRMYAPDAAPQSGSLYTEDMDIDSPWHYHDMHQLTYAFHGIVEVEDSYGRYASSPTLATWVPAGVQHRAIFHGVKTVSIFFTKDEVKSAGDRTRVFVVSPLMREMLKEALRWPLQGPEAPLRSTVIEALACSASKRSNTKPGSYCRRATIRASIVRSTTRCGTPMRSCRTSALSPACPSGRCGGGSWPRPA